ncbi:MAG: response regulator transcription factor [Actinomycetota bacterium]|nr:response regulator transcription factor [Actinomycetota bacterium]
MIKVVVVDDESLVRSGLRMILESASDIEVVATCDGVAAVAEVRRTRPDVVLLDLRMPVVDGLSVLAELRAGGEMPRVAILTTFDAEEHVSDALRLGVAGFLLKDTEPEDLISAVRSLARGAHALSPSVVDTLVDVYLEVKDGRNAAVAAQVDALGERERAVLALVAQGLSNAEIGERLYLSVGTVKDYVSILLTKLGALNRVQVAVTAVQAGLVRTDGDRR